MRPNLKDKFQRSLSTRLQSLQNKPLFFFKPMSQSSTPTKAEDEKTEISNEKLVPNHVPVLVEETVFPDSGDGLNKETSKDKEGTSDEPSTFSFLQNLTPKQNPQDKAPTHLPFQRPKLSFNQPTVQTSKSPENPKEKEKEKQEIDYRDVTSDDPIDDISHSLLEENLQQNGGMPILEECSSVDARNLEKIEPKKSKKNV